MNSQKPMTEEEIKKIANDIFNESIMNNLDSSIIFKYIKGLEKENQKYKEVIDNAIVKLERYSNIVSEASAYGICVDLLHLLKEVE
ncbi:MAG TPA: hypothetical protein IAB58_01265 [Candidatus Pelethosoma merdigallinarum]|nr:hypothetical protein [Candidatus Pelethosoma merdigallinarum]